MVTYIYKPYRIVISDLFYTVDSRENQRQIMFVSVSAGEWRYKTPCTLSLKGRIVKFQGMALVLVKSGK